MKMEQVERTVKALEEELGEARRSEEKMDKVVNFLYASTHLVNESLRGRQ